MTNPLELLGDLTAIGIEGRELQLDTIADNQSDGLVSKRWGHPRRDAAPLSRTWAGFEPDPVQGVGQHLFDDTC